MSDIEDSKRGSPFGIDWRYSRMRAISDEQHPLLARLIAGPGLLLLLLLLLVGIPLLLVLSIP